MVEKNIRIMTWFNFFTDFKLYAPIAIIYFANVSGSFALGMSIFSIAQISSAFFEVPTGIYSDFIGRKRTVIFGALSAVIYSFFYALGGSYWILIMGAVMEGMSRSFYSGNNNTLLYDTLSQHGKTDAYSEVIGKVSSMFQVALAISGILGGLLAQWSFSIILWISFLSQIICFVLSFFLIEPKIHKHESSNIYSHLKEALSAFWHNKRLRLLSISSFLGWGFGEAAYQFQAAFYGTLWPLWAVGFAKTLSNTGGAISFRLAGKVIKRFGPAKVLIADNIVNRIINIFATAIPTSFSPLLISLTSLFFGFSMVAKGTLLQKEFSDEKRATMGSLDSLAGSLFFGIIAFLLGIFADVLSPAKAFLLLQLFQVSNLLIYWKLFSHPLVAENKI